MISVRCHVYVLHSIACDKLYVGQTEDPVKRLERHNGGSERFTASFRPWEIVWCIDKPSRQEAIALERKLKNLSRERLEKFMSKYPEGGEKAKRFKLAGHIK